MRLFAVTLILLLQSAEVSASEPAGAPVLSSPTVLSQAQKVSDQIAARLRGAQKRQRELEAQKRGLRETYNAQLREVDRLKRSRASWRRDRKLQDQQAQSQQTATRLQNVDGKLRGLRAEISREQTEFSKAIRYELTAGAHGTRRSYLESTWARLQAGLRKAPRKISIPDMEPDEFSDQEELLAKIALIEQAERKLIGQEKSLARRIQHYSHMDTLIGKKQRAFDLGAFDDNNRVRRSTGRVGAANRRSSGEGSGNEEERAGSPAPANDDSADRPEPESSPAGGEPSSPPPSSSDGDTSSSPTGSSESESSSPPPSSPDGNSPSAPPSRDPEEPGTLEATSIVLADVVDAQTQGALRRAHDSRSPKMKAAAAKMARAQVEEQLKGLKLGKARIIRHLRRLQAR